MVLGDNVRKTIDQLQDGSTATGVEIRGFRQLTTPTDETPSSYPTPKNRQSEQRANNNEKVSSPPPMSPKPKYPMASSPPTPVKPTRLTISAPVPGSTTSTLSNANGGTLQNNHPESTTLLQQGYARPMRKIPNREDDYSFNSHRARSPHFKKFFKPKCTSWVSIALGIICLVQLIILIVLLTLLINQRGKEDGGEKSITWRGRGFAKPGEVIFRDDFEAFNRTTWRHERYITEDGFVIFGSDEKNSFVEDGMLYIQPTFTADDFNATFMTYGNLVIGKTIEKSCSSFFRTQCEKTANGGTMLNPIKSATLKTSQSFSFQYGMIQFRAKMPRGDWITTEISLRPRYEFFGEPTDSAKIIIVTSRGNANYAAANGTQFGQERVCSQLVYSDSYSSAINSMVQFCHNSPPNDGFGDDFHDYKFDWQPDMMRLFIDELQVGKFIANSFVPNSYKHVVITGDDSVTDSKKSSFNQQFYIELKVNVGSGFPETGYRAHPYRKPWVNNRAEAPRTFWSARTQWEPTWNDTSALVIDYIKVTALDDRAMR